MLQGARDFLLEVLKGWPHGVRNHVLKREEKNAGRCGEDARKGDHRPGESSLRNEPLKENGSGRCRRMPSLRRAPRRSPIIRTDSLGTTH